MTEQYRTDQLAVAQVESAKARAAYEAARTRTARLAAAEDLEFWSNKTAFLERTQ